MSVTEEVWTYWLTSQEPNLMGTCRSLEYRNDNKRYSWKVCSSKKFWSAAHSSYNQIKTSPNGATKNRNLPLRWRISFRGYTGNSHAVKIQSCKRSLFYHFEATWPAIAVVLFFKRSLNRTCIQRWKLCSTNLEVARRTVICSDFWIHANFRYISEIRMFMRIR